MVQSVQSGPFDLLAEPLIPAFAGGDREEALTPTLSQKKREVEALDDVRTQVWALLTTLYPQHELVERRRENRFPFPYLIRLTPIAEDGITPRGESVVVVGKHLSERGLGFYHPKPLPYRRMIASLEAGNGRWLGFLIDLNWCRFTKQGWYESGGRLLQSVLPLSDESA